MQTKTLQPIRCPLRGEVQVPADKSVSQRAVILGAIAKGTTIVRHFLQGDDCRQAVRAVQQMGIRLTMEESPAETVLKIKGNGRYGLSPTARPLHLGNSGTAMRLFPGVLAAQPFTTTLCGDRSLSARPMDRILTPLRTMGAEVAGKRRGEIEYPPLRIRGRPLRAIDYVSPVPSAQVKSCVLLAGLYCRGTTRLREAVRTRDHTERMLALFQAPIMVRGRTISLRGGAELRSPRQVNVPGDISSAVFF